MTDSSAIKGAIIGLIGFAATEEQILLSASDPGEAGDATCWAAYPLVTHNTEFRSQQLHRLVAVRTGRTPAEFSEVDHRSPAVYRDCRSEPADQVGNTSGQVSAELITEVGLVSDADLREPARNPWLKGRLLWLQIIVRGFWHPTGHLIDYYLAHAQSGRAIALASHGAATAAYLGAPDPARGMAIYNLACAQAVAGNLAEATEALTESIALNPDLKSNAVRDPDLRPLGPIQG
jgi:hypothetical protein